MRIVVIDDDGQGHMVEVATEQVKRPEAVHQRAESLTVTLPDGRAVACTYRPREDGSRDEIDGMPVYRVGEA